MNFMILKILFCIFLIYFLEIEIAEYSLIADAFLNKFIPLTKGERIFKLVCI